MLHLLIDENFDSEIRIPKFLTCLLPTAYCLPSSLITQHSSLFLAWAAENQRILVTHDVNTIPRYASERVRASQSMPGVIIIPEDLAVGKAIEELAILIECCKSEELNNQVKYLPI